ncbi:MAG: porin [Gammaproteobacteria bacterium]|nr:porin [Gammaproteobacteria bacterium]
MNKKMLTATIGAALYAVGPTASALEAKVSGQVNRAIMWADDGVTPKTHHVDNAMSGTRFRFTGSDDLSTDLKAGVTLEFEYLSNSSSSVTQSSKTTDSGLKERVLEAYFSGGFGRIGLGQGAGAADGGTEVDLSGTNVVQSAAVADIGGSITFMTSTGTTGPKITDAINQQDFESRYDRLRYDSPAFGLLKFAVSTGTKTDTINEAAITFNSNLGGSGTLAAAIGYSKEDTNVAGTPETTKGGSLSWLASFGLNVTLAVSNVQNDATPTAKDADFRYLKIGYKSGDHAVALDYGKGEDFTAGDTSEMVGVGYVYTAAKFAELYAGAKVHRLDRPGTEFEDITIVTAGTRLKF